MSPRRFVRSITVYLVRKGTLSEYVYLEHGAHWAIGALATILIVSIGVHINEIITGLVGVAFIGVLSALMALQLERGRDHAVLRALGLTPGQLVRLGLVETGVMGLFAGLLALPLGWGLAQLLIHVVNQRSFGWSMDSLVPPGLLLDALALAITAALLAGLYPALRMARTRPAAALRDE